MPSSTSTTPSSVITPSSEPIKIGASTAIKAPKKKECCSWDSDYIIILYLLIFIMGTVCYAPDIPLINRPINPYNGLPISRESVRNSMVNHSLARKMNEDYQIPLLANSLMKPSNLDQLPLANSVQVTTTTTTTPILPVPVATVPVQIGAYEPNSIV